MDAIKNIVISILIIVIAFITYSNSLHSPFAFDDTETIINNKSIHSYSILLKWNIPRYIGYLTFTLNYHFNKLDPYGYHIINVFIHALNGILAFLICSLLLRILKLNLSELQAYSFSLIASLLFILHPIQTQAVTYISQRFASLAALFAFSCIYCYLQYRNKSSLVYYIASLLFALLAFKTKENTATLPLIIIMLEWLVLRHSGKIKKIIIAIIPYFLLLSVIAFSFVGAKKPVAELVHDIIAKSVETSTITRTTYLMTQFRVITTYLRLLLLPIRQSIDYYYPLSQSFFESKTFLCFLLLLCLLVTSLIIRKKYTAISIGMLWFFIFLIVESSIIPIADVIFEHRLYLPSFGFFFSLTSLIFYIFHPQLQWEQSLPLNQTKKIITRKKKHKEEISFLKKTHSLLYASSSSAY